MLIDSGIPATGETVVEDKTNFGHDRDAIRAEKERRAAEVLNLLIEQFTHLIKTAREHGERSSTYSCFQGESSTNLMKRVDAAKALILTDAPDCVSQARGVINPDQVIVAIANTIKGLARYFGGELPDPLRSQVAILETINMTNDRLKTALHDLET